MSGGDHKRTQRPTKRLDAARLAGLTRKSVATTPPPQRAAAATTPPPATTQPAQPAPAMPRTMTVEDPMTTQLLAEVARRSETADFDDKTDDAADKNTVARHPHLTRRKRKS
jgi:hypothetical protein